MLNVKKNKTTLNPMPIIGKPYIENRYFKLTTANVSAPALQRLASNGGLSGKVFVFIHLVLKCLSFRVVKLLRALSRFLRSHAPVSWISQKVGQRRPLLQPFAKQWRVSSR